MPAVLVQLRSLTEDIHKVSYDNKWRTLIAITRHANVFRYSLFWCGYLENETDAIVVS